MYYSLDYGKGWIVLSWGPGENDHSLHKTFVELLKDVPEGSILIAERSLANFDIKDYNNGLVLAEQRKIELRAVSTHAAKGYRRKWNEPKPSRNATIKDDIKDAKILLLLFGEGSNRAFGSFEERKPKPLPTNLRARLTRKVVDARRNEKWKQQKQWLKSHGFELATVLCSARVVAEEVLALGLGRKEYRKYTRISEYGRALPIHRSNGTNWLFRKTKKKDWSRLEDRKVRAKAVNQMIDRIWHQSTIPDRTLEEFFQ